MVYAENPADHVNIVVPTSCSFSDEQISGDSEHSATMHNGEYRSEIGTTTFKIYCNDNSGYSVYAIGYSGDEYGNTEMVHSDDATYNFDTGTATSGSNSNWAMKLLPVSGTYAPTIQSDSNGSYTGYHVVPTTYAKIATFPSNTDVPGNGTGLGSAFQSTYAVWISNSQVAGTYTGKVRYTMIHPHNGEAPLSPQITQTSKICYYANASDAVGTMGCQTIPTSGTTDGVSPTSATLLASNFSKTGYGFAGWSDKFDYATNSEARFYGPMETITYTKGQYSGDNNGLSLYAVWVKSTGSLQDADKVATLCGTGTGSLTQAPTNGTANLSSVSALTDQRDNQTYAIAKLADGKCWMIENLRLDNQYTVGNNQTDSTVTNESLSQGYNSSFIGLAGSESADFKDSTTPNSLYTTESNVAGKNTISGSNQGYRFPRYNKLNTPADPANRPTSPTSNTFTNDATTPGMYSYGNYYTWAAVIADTTNYTSKVHTTTSICPKGWSMPQGDNTSAGFAKLDRDMGGTGANQSTAEASNRWRKYPTNLLYSGYFNTSSARSRGSVGYYWSSTASGPSYSYNLYLASTYAHPGTAYYVKNFGYTARCVLGQ